MKQLIDEHRIRLTESGFKSNSIINLNSDINILNSFYVINEVDDYSNGTIVSSSSDLAYKHIGNIESSYSIVELKSNELFYLEFILNGTIYNLKTYSFSYRNNEERISNIKIANGTLVQLDSIFISDQNTKESTVSYLLIKSFNFYYLNDRYTFRN